MALLMATEVPSYYSEVLKRRGQHAGQTGQMNRKNCIQMQRLSGGLYGLQSQYLWTSEGDCDTFESSDPNGIRTRVTAVKGQCPNRWTIGSEEAAEYSSSLALLQEIFVWRYFFLMTVLINKARGRVPA